MSKLSCWKFFRCHFVIYNKQRLWRCCITVKTKGKLGLSFKPGWPACWHQNALLADSMWPMSCCPLILAIIFCATKTQLPRISCKYSGVCAHSKPLLPLSLHCSGKGFETKYNALFQHSSCITKTKIPSGCAVVDRPPSIAAFQKWNETPGAVPTKQFVEIKL